jgi:hypothetical protein
MKAPRRDVFQAQHDQAAEALAKRVKLLASRKVEGKKALAKDPLWRKLNSDVKQIKTRIDAMQFEADREVDLAKRREERALKAKEPKVKKKKVAAAPAKKGGGEKKAKKEAAPKA